ncbi:MAG: cytochrome C oxidase subunit IV family protein [Nitrospirae bacterium]|nr:cytochrome C oxidase subunit IV family protein [Nitrospirota bacterium]
MNKKHNNLIGSRMYVIVWLCLLVLTALTVAVSGMKLGISGSLTSVIIATLKASLILLFFMHLKYERFLITAMLLLTVMTIAVIIGLTFFDIWYRY